MICSINFCSASTKPLEHTGDVCVDFFFFMQGAPAERSLSVVLQHENQTDDLVWASTDTSSMWRQERISLKVADSDTVRI